MDSPDDTLSKRDSSSTARNDSLETQDSREVEECQNNGDDGNSTNNDVIDSGQSFDEPMKDKAEGWELYQDNYRAPDSNDEEYAMGRQFRGLVLLISTVPESEVGTIGDLTNGLQEMGFLVKTLWNPTELAINNFLKEARKSDDLKEYDCLVVLVVTSSQGDNIKVQDGSICVRSIWQSFTADKCPFLTGKPKIFIKLQTIKVSKEKVGENIRIDSSKATGYTIPCTIDFLIALPTLTGRSDVDVETCISAVKNAFFMAEQPNRDLLSELTAAGFVTVSTLTKKICFPERKTHDKQVHMQLDSYSLEEGKRLAVVFNHEKFSEHYDQDPKPRERKGSNVDRDRLKKVLAQLGFDIYPVEDDRTRSQIRETIKEVIEQYPSLKVVLVVVLTHGEQTELCAEDIIYKLTGFWKDFQSEHWKNVLKLFVIQACQGPEKGGVVRLEDSTIRVRKTSRARSISLLNFTPIIPELEDTIVAYATVPGYVAWRNEKSGSWFIQTLCDHLEKLHDTRTDLQTMLTNVSRLVALQVFDSRRDSIQTNSTRSRTVSESSAQRKQAACIVNTTKKRVFLDMRVDKST